jgi:hypothetical protein
MIPFGESPSQHENQERMGPNPYLVGLGIILLELSENQLFDEWLRDKNVEIPRENTIERSIRGKAWLEEIVARTRMSEQYAYVVQLCLTCAFNPVPRSQKLINEGFREAVYSQILVPLEKEYLNIKKDLEIVT